MEAEALFQHHPPTPPNISTELHPGLHQIAQYNADRNYTYDDSLSIATSYGSPLPVVNEGISQHSSHLGSQQGEAFGLGIQYDEYSQDSGFYHENEDQFQRLPSTQAMYSGSPLTPRSSTDFDDSSGRTRSGRTIAASSSPPEEKSRPKATPRSKKAKTAKGDKPKTPKLTAPLSILTKDMTSIPVRNMEEWVNRPTEVRRKEVEKRNGYVTRPMNSFMLYRSAYAERTKQWCLQNNHQVVSSVSGESWPLEPPEVRELYNEYAKIERINHQNAHPDYKFSPSKASTPSRKRKGDYSDDEPSDIDDGEWNPGRSRSRNRYSSRPDRSFDYPGRHISPEYYDRSFGPNGGGMNRSSWEITNEGRPPPMPLPQNDLYYSHTTVHPNISMGTGALEDLRFLRVDTPVSSMQFSSGHALLGLPGGNAADLMQQLSFYASTPLGDESQVDPMLLAYDDGHPHDMGVVVDQQLEFRNGYMGMIEGELDPAGVGSLLTATSTQEEYHPEPWQPDLNMVPLEQESEFEKWMGDH